MKMEKKINDLINRYFKCYKKQFYDKIDETMLKKLLIAKGLINMDFFYDLMKKE